MWGLSFGPRGKGCNTPWLGRCRGALSGTGCSVGPGCMLPAFFCSSWPGRQGEGAACIPPRQCSGRWRAPPPGQSSVPSRKTGALPTGQADLVPALPGNRCGGLRTGHTLSGPRDQVWDDWSRGEKDTQSREDGGLSSTRSQSGLLVCRVSVWAPPEPAAEPVTRVRLDWFTGRWSLETRGWGGRRVIE